jgi:transposase
MGKMTLITGAERRRRWSAEERRQILVAANAPGAVVADVSRRWDVSTSLIYKWRNDERDAALMSGFAPVLIEDKTSLPAPRVEAAPIVVELGGALVRIGAQALPSLIKATLKALRP